MPRTSEALPPILDLIGKMQEEWGHIESAVQVLDALKAELLKLELPSDLALRGLEELYEQGFPSWDRAIQVCCEVRNANSEKRGEIHRLKTALESMVAATWASTNTLREMASAALDGEAVGSRPRKETSS